MKNNRIFYFASLAFFFIICVIMFSKSLAPGLLLFGADTITLNLPFRMFAQEVFQKYGIMPVWMPGLFLGVPLLDSTNSILFYPFDFLVNVLGIDIKGSFTSDLIFHMLLGAAGMFIFLKHAGAGKRASAFGALVYIMSGIFISFVYVGHWGNIKAAAMIPNSIQVGA